MSGRRYVWVSALAMATIAICACGDDGDTGETSSSTSSGQGGDATSTTTSSGMGGAGGDMPCEGSTSTADCATYCVGVVAAACPGGPTQQECEQGCEMLNGVVDQCPAWGAVVDCAETAPAFTCFMGETVPEGCETQFYCVSQCVN